MKKGTFITLISAILLLMAVNSVYAQEANGFKKFDVKEDFTENGFQWFRDAEIIAVGNQDKHNAMTKPKADGMKTKLQPWDCIRLIQRMALHTILRQKW